jgi:hypothetical protein
MFGGLFNTEEITRDTIQDCLQRVATELDCDYNGLFIMIKPVTEDFDQKYYIYRTEAGTAPKFVREISLKEILKSS